jgi:hypothetical protein
MGQCKWLDYDGVTNKIDVAIAPVLRPFFGRPKDPLISTIYDLSTVLTELAYVGFSASTGITTGTKHYVLGWSFSMGGLPPPLIDMIKLPELPPVKLTARIMDIFWPIAIMGTLLLAMSTTIFLLVLRWVHYADLLEDWEVDFGPHRLTYKDLVHATEGFNKKHLIGRGGFGQVYKGLLPTSKTEVAVKSVSHESKQGMREFIAEVVSIGHLQHRNIVHLLGYCRCKRELIFFLMKQEGKPLLIIYLIKRVTRNSTVNQETKKRKVKNQKNYT